MMGIVLFLSLSLALACASCPPPAAAAAAASSSSSSSSSSCRGTRTTTPFCGFSCRCSDEDDLKLREAFLAEVKAHGYHDASCRSRLKAYLCAVCVAAAAPVDDDHPSSALPLHCAGTTAPMFISTTRHEDDLGGNDVVGSSTLCLHRASTQAYDGVVPLHDGSGRLLCWRRNGQIWLATVDGSVLRVGDRPVVDLGSRVSQDAAARGGGLAGVAVHSSGRLFVSYYTTDDGVALLLAVDQLLIASWSGHEATTRRLFSMLLPDRVDGFHLDYYGGQILFRPNNDDPFLYLVAGPAQSDGQLRAKILHFRVGGMPSGNGTITTPTEAAKVYASLLGVPRRCAFDADRPHDLYCAIAKDDQEVVYLISDSNVPSSSPMPPSISRLVAHEWPTSGTPPSLVGGLLYRGYADDTLIGSYIYMDGSEFWWTVVSPARNYTTTRNLSITCAAPATTSPCRGGDFVGSSVTSFAEDADKNTLLLATDGVYVIVQPSLCDADDTHTKEDPTFTILEWIFSVIGSLVATLGGGYGAYKTCGCFNGSDITVHGNVTILEGIPIEKKVELQDLEKGPDGR